MFLFGEPDETLATRFRRDASTNLPLLEEQDAVFGVVLTYLALPYSVAEYGCGQKSSLIVERLVAMGLPAWAVRRGIAVERDMSPATMETTDPALRPHAILLDNPLAEAGDLADPALLRLFAEEPYEVDARRHEIHVGRYVLHHEERVQLLRSRSHIFPVVSFWDRESGRVVERVVDPTLDARGPFPLAGLRALLRADEALVLTAPLLGSFRLREEFLTDAQRAEVEEFLGRQTGERDLVRMPRTRHDQLVRRLDGAEPGSVGDPSTWSYANNFHGHDPEHMDAQRARTGDGDVVRPAIRSLIEAREGFSHEVGELRSQLEETARRLDLRRHLHEDAVRAERELQPLADVALTVAYFRSLGALAGILREGRSLRDELSELRARGPLRGIGSRLRRRIDSLAVTSLDEDGAIDARALNPAYRRAAIETARQMDRAGLSVFVDRVGNLHGVLLTEDERAELAAGFLDLGAVLEHSVVHMSHIDTVQDAGKFDGRLGVTAGIEMAHLIRDLEVHHGLRTATDTTRVRMVVTAFVGEEMSFTGEGISMPGSAAVAGLCAPERVHAMTNRAGERYGDALLVLLEALENARREGRIELAHALDDGDGVAISSCPDPTLFFSPHTYERHIEQGPILDRLGVPVVLVGRIMGIHQEDFELRGPRAEQAALELDCRLRDLTREDDFANTRVTVGVLERRGERVCLPSVRAGLRCLLEGERNHAGATETPDRRDPGVAAGRLARVFQQWVDSHRERLRGIRAIVGDVTVWPGTGRNVIPGRAGVTFALDGEDLDEDLAAEVFRNLRGHAVGQLSASVADGGEGVTVRRMEPVGFVNTGGEVRMSLDLRDADPRTVEDFRRRIVEIRNALDEEFDVEISSTVEQSLDPTDLEPSGQVLLMERSYGGSHNPNETELLVDLTRGCLLQYAVMQDVLRREDTEGLDLFSVTEGRMPRSWLRRMPRFVSGALHDTCSVVTALTSDPAAPALR